MSKYRWSPIRHHILHFSLLALAVVPSSFAQKASAGSARSQVASNQQVQIEGQIEIIYQDFRDGHGKSLYTLKRADGTRVPLYFKKNPPTHLLTGDHVRVSGQKSGAGLILYTGGDVTNSAGSSGGGGTSGSSIPVPNTLGTQSVLVILVNFQDDVIQPYALTDIESAFFTSSSSFFQENSYGQTSLAGTAVGWYTIPDSVTTCNISQIATDAQNAATAAGVNLANYTRYVYFFPYNAACAFAGASNVGGNPSQSWINGTVDIHVINHELGHAFGLWHSHLDDCGTSATICSTPNVIEYGDPMDVMGTPQGASPDYNAFQKERLGWLNYGASPVIQTVTSSGAYTIYPAEQIGSGASALKILQSTNPTTGAKTWYYLESRQAVGFDSFLTNSIYYTQNETTGVLFHLGTDGDGNSSDLLDMTPSTPTPTGWLDMSLAVGQSFTDATAGVTFTPTAVSSTGATIQVTLGTCSLAAPTVSVTPSQSQYVTSGTAVNFTVTVTDHDSSGCGPATFNFANALPSGWAAVWNTASLSLSPGKSGSATITVTSPAGTADGSYGIGISASNAVSSAYSGSAIATYIINTAPLTVTLATNQSTYSPGQTVTAIVTMLYGTLPAIGASVNVTVTPPSGKSTTLTGTTGNNGVALLSYTLSRNAPAGTYQVQYGGGSTKHRGGTAAATQSANTSFTVQ